MVVLTNKEYQNIRKSAKSKAKLYSAPFAVKRFLVDSLTVGIDSKRIAFAVHFAIRIPMGNNDNKCKWYLVHSQRQGVSGSAEKKLESFVKTLDHNVKTKNVWLQWWFILKANNSQNSFQKLPDFKQRHLMGQN